MTSKEWKDVKLKDITILISRGITPKYTDSEGVIVINQKCIRNGQINLKESRLTDDKTQKIPENKFVDNNDILICSTGIGTLGRVGFLRNKLNTKLTVDSHVSIVRVNKDYTNPIFLGYNLFSRQSEIEAMAKGSTGQTELSRIDLGEMNISLPPLETQEKIAHVLSSLDDKIELNNKINQNLEQQAQAIFKSWFVDFEPFGGKMPEDWRIGKVEEIINIYDSKRIPLSNKERSEMTKKVYPYYGATSLMDYVDNYIFDGIYLLLGEDGTVIDDFGFPILQYVWGKFWVNNHAHIMTGKNGYNVESLYLFFKQKNIKSIVTGAVQAKISQTNLKNLDVIIPAESTMEEFNKIIAPIFNTIRNNTNEIKILTQLRDTLLPKLISGEIDVDKVEV